MLKRFHLFFKTKPLHEWAFLVGLLLIINALFYLLLPGRHWNPGQLYLYLSFSLSAPTMALVRRFSEEQRRSNPVPPQQEAAIGNLSLLMGASSILSGLILGFNKRFGLILPEDTGASLLLVFSISILLALAFGYAARQSRSGAAGLSLTCIWLGIILITAFVGLVRHLA